MVTIPGGEPLLHKEIGTDRRRARRSAELRHPVHQRAPPREEDPPVQAEPVLHLLGPPRRPEDEHARPSSAEGRVRPGRRGDQGRAGRGLPRHDQRTLFDGADAGPGRRLPRLRHDDLDVDGVTISPGYAYERAPDQEHFLNRRRTKELFRAVFRRGKRQGAGGSSSRRMFLDFLAGNQEYHCTPWGNPTRNIFGWQRPCYLLSEGYVPTFKELMEGTDWDAYGTGAYEKCADCMVHCGYEPTAVNDTVSHPLKALRTVLAGIRTEGPMAPEISLENQRPAEYVFDKMVREAAASVHAPPSQSGARSAGRTARLKAARAPPASRRRAAAALGQICAAWRGGPASAADSRTLAVRPAAARGRWRAGRARPGRRRRGSPRRAGRDAPPRARGRWLSMSTARAPVAAWRRALSAASDSGRSTPATVPPRACGAAPWQERRRQLRRPRR